MSARVTYWTGTWDPAKEAISKEVNALRVRGRARAPVVSFSPGQPIRIFRNDRVLQLAGWAWPVLRGVAALLEPRGQVTHVFGGHSSWHLLRALGRRPILLTVVVGGDRSWVLPLQNIARVVVETETVIQEWVESGVDRERITVVRPGIDMEWFRPPAVAAEGPFTLLFASTPSDPAEIETRGIPCLVELARLRPDIRVLVPWRQWGDLRSSRRTMETLRPPPNFVVTDENVTDMRKYYARSHATIVCFDRGVGKVCPNFVIEGLASGLPCISTPEGGLANDLIRSGAGVVVGRDGGSLSKAVDVLRSGWPAYSRRARQLAHDEFDLQRYQTRYEELYTEIAAQNDLARNPDSRERPPA